MTMKFDEKTEKNIVDEVIKKLLEIERNHNINKDVNPKKVMVSNYTFIFISKVIIQKYGFMQIAYKEPKIENIKTRPLKVYGGINGFRFDSVSFKREYINDFLNGYTFIINEMMDDFEFAFVYRIGDYK